MMRFHHQISRLLACVLVAVLCIVAVHASSCDAYEADDASSYDAAYDDAIADAGVIADDVGGAVAGNAVFGSYLTDDVIAQYAHQAESLDDSPAAANVITYSNLMPEHPFGAVVSGDAVEVLIGVENHGVTNITLGVAIGHFWYPFDYSKTLYNLTASHSYDTLVVPGQQATISYRFSMQFEPRDIGFTIALQHFDEEVPLVIVSGTAFNGTLTVIDKTVASFDLQMIFLFFCGIVVMYGLVLSIQQAFFDVPSVGKRRRNRTIFDTAYSHAVAVSSLLRSIINHKPSVSIPALSPKGAAASSRVSSSQAAPASADAAKATSALKVPLEPKDVNLEWIPQHVLDIEKKRQTHRR